jgi:hypothetical protein
MYPSEFINAFQRNGRARPHPKRWKRPIPPIRKVWPDHRQPR